MCRWPRAPCTIADSEHDIVVTVVQFEEHHRVFAAVQPDTFVDLTVDSDRCVLTILSSLVCDLFVDLPTFLYHYAHHLAVTCL